MSDYSLLLVDDEEDLLDSFSAWFSKRGFNVTTANHPSLALVSAAYKKFDVAIVDITLPEMNGLELIDQIRALGEFPIIVLSGDNNPRLKDAALRRGVSRFLVKPISMAEVEEVVRASLSISSSDSSTPVTSITSAT